MELFRKRFLLPGETRETPPSRGVSPAPLVSKSRSRVSSLAFLALLAGAAPQLTSCSTDKQAETEQGVQDTYEYEAHERAANVLIDQWAQEAQESNNELQKQILLAAQTYPELDVLAVAVKESHLNDKAENGGYMQLTATTLNDLRRLIPAAQVNNGKAVDSPEYNMAYGKLYMAVLRVNYVDAQKSRYGALDEANRRRLVRIMYNMGPTSVGAMWEKFKCHNVDDLVKSMEDHVFDNVDMPGVDFFNNRKTAWDERYFVDYEQSDIVRYYLTNPPNLDVPAFEGSPYPSMRKLIISARYDHITRGIVEALKKDKEAYLTKINPEEADTGGMEVIDTLATRNIEIQAGETIFNLTWRFGVSQNYLINLNPELANGLKAGQKIKVPADEVQRAVAPYLHTLPDGKHWILASRKGIYSHPDYQRYFKDEIHIESQEEILAVVIAFNRQFNPELSNLNDELSNVPKGAFIWLPNVEFYEADMEGHFIEEAPPVIHPEPQTPAAVPNTKLLDTSTPGQYVIKVKGKWRRDVDEMREGAELFSSTKWSDHPTWVEEGGFPKTRQIARFQMTSVEGVVLHSTISNDLAAVRRDRSAHFGVTRDGTIYRIVHVPNDPNNPVKASETIAMHAGRSTWDGEQNLNQSWIGIEVVANEGQAWSDAQFDSVEELVEWLGGFYGFQKNDVLMHKQVAYSIPYGRGRKSDVQCGSELSPDRAEADFWSRLDLPDNSRILDLDVTSNYTTGNWGRIDSGRDGHANKGWDGLDAAVHTSHWAR